MSDLRKDISVMTEDSLVQSESLSHLKNVHVIGRRDEFLSMVGK